MPILILRLRESFSLRRAAFCTLALVVAAGRHSPQPLGAPTRVLGASTGDADSRIVTDSANDEVVLYAGPFKIPGMAAMHGMPDMPAMSGMDHEAGEAKENHAAHASPRGN